ncbi:hypothetical protein [Amycolatopsis sp. NPDC051128]|uniref:hypothetical protein n=1 Tax=Amycolatopsis sp. NPDC051128 TaxID=3155412 RepID=UPI0034241220
MKRLLALAVAVLTGGAVLTASPVAAAPVTMRAVAGLRRRRDRVHHLTRPRPTRRSTLNEE